MSWARVGKNYTPQKLEEKRAIFRSRLLGQFSAYVRAERSARAEVAKRQQHNNNNSSSSRSSVSAIKPLEQQRLLLCVPLTLYFSAGRVRRSVGLSTTRTRTAEIEHGDHHLYLFPAIMMMGIGRPPVFAGGCFGKLHRSRRNVPSLATLLRHRTSHTHARARFSRVDACFSFSEGSRLPPVPACNLCRTPVTAGITVYRNIPGV